MPAALHPDAPTKPRPPKQPCALAAPPGRSGNRLSGPLPPEAGSGWASMERLALNNNSFTGTIPAEWGGMGNLLQLYL